MQFCDIIGQEKVSERLIRSVLDQRISHAQLFVGAPGAGSLAIAIAYAQYIMCENRSGQDSCGSCASCIKNNKLIHPDLHFVYPIALSKDCRVSTVKAKEWREVVLDNPYITLSGWFDSLKAENKQAVIGVDESAEIIRKLNLTTYETEYKIMIIWQADKMHTTAANKLLKILEEPPEKTVFILISEQEEQLLSTIVSRTQRIVVPKIKHEELEAVLLEEYDLSPESALNISNLADGNFSEALSLINETESLEQNLDYFKQLMRLSIKFNPTDVLSWIDDIVSIGRERQKNFINYALHLLRESLLMNNQVDELVKLTDSERAFIAKFSPFIHEKNSARFVAELNRASVEMERNANPKILYMDLAFKFNELLNLPKPN